MKYSNISSKNNYSLCCKFALFVQGYNAVFIDLIYSFSNLQVIKYFSMKKTFCTIVLLLVFTSVFSQKKYNSRFEIKTNLLNILATGPSVALEYRLNKNWSTMLSLASGKIDYRDFGVTNYKTSTFEFRKYALHQTLFIGPYLKDIRKQVYREEIVSSASIPVLLAGNRDFLGNGLSGGVTMGLKLPLSHNLALEFNSQIGIGHYYQMNDNFGNLPSGTYLDARLGLWLGFRF